MFGSFFRKSWSPQQKSEKLCAAIQSGDLEKAKSAIEIGANVDAPGEYGAPPIHMAAIRGHGSIVELLHSHGANLNAYNKEGDTPLHLKPQAGKLNAVDALLKAGADPNLLDSDGGTPLHRAVKRCNAAHTKVLLEDSRTDPNIRDKADRTPLNYALDLIGSDREAILNLLTGKGIDLNNKNNDGDTLLHWAIKENRRGTLARLIEKGADLNTTNKDGDTPLHLTIKKGCTNIFKELLDSGADKNMADKTGVSPLRIAVDIGNDEVVKHLLKAKATFKRADKGKESLLYVAVAKGHIGIAKRLLKAGAKFDKSDKSKESFLYLAAQSGDTELIKCLVHADAEFDASDKGLFNEFRVTIGKAFYQLGIEHESRASKNSDAKDLNEAVVWMMRAAECDDVFAQYKLARYILEPPPGLIFGKKEISKFIGASLPMINLDDISKKRPRGFDYVRSEMTDAEKADGKKTRQRVADLNEQLCAAFSNILLYEKVPIDIVNGQTGEIIIPANRKISKTLLFKMAVAHQHIEMDPSPIAEKVYDIIARYSKQIVEAQSGLDGYRRRVLENTPAYNDLKKTCECAEEGDVDAQHALACFYLHGTDYIWKDIQKAKEWFIAAIKRGHASSLAGLGDCYKAENNDADALECYHLAAKDNDPHGQFHTAMLMDCDEDSFPLLKLAALGGHAEAQRTLAFRYANGNGVTEDKIMAAKWFYLAATQGDAEAQRELGNSYLDGFIVDESTVLSYCRKKAFSWYLKAAKQNDYEAAHKVAHCYAEGIGTPKDEIEAFMWERRARDIQTT